MKRNMKILTTREQGGTLLGLVIGLVVGLGIAVLVALMITKTPTPFTNKLGMSKPADAPLVQLTDPNKPLYGSSYKEAPSNTPVANTSSITTVQETVAQAKGLAAGTAVNAGSSPDAEIMPEIVKFNSNSAAADDLDLKKTMEERAAYYLQVGAFRDSSDAENVRAKLALIGIESAVKTKNAEGDNLFRVRIGPFDHLDEMNRVRSKLVENSIDVAVIKTPK
ncbi:MAG: hypothetical protein K0R08_2166 [Solimicrobium sp.]|jgi:cell division protein FtsN|nr:hypothetical protein [Solimicrobium sp.]